MSDSVWPHRRQPTRLPHPWDSPGKNTGVGCNFLLQCMKVRLLHHAQLLATPWTAAHQAPPSRGFSKHEYWSWVPLPSLILNLIMTLVTFHIYLKYPYFHKFLIYLSSIILFLLLSNIFRKLFLWFSFYFLNVKDICTNCLSC